MTPVSSQLLHDLRTPLNQIIGYSEMLAEDVVGPRPEGFATDLEKIRAAGQRMLALIEENFRPGAMSAAGASNAGVGTPSPRPTELMTGATVSPGLLLVVDDDVLNRAVLSRRLGRQGHVVETASSGSEALHLMREIPFDLVLLDIMMPDMDGYEVLGRMKSADDLSRIPVIMVSALSEVESVVRCIEAGAEDYLTKPFNPILLKARIGSCLEKKRARDRETALLEQVRSSYSKLQELEKLRDDMRNMIVHDLRTPLTSVIIGLEMLERGRLTSEQRDLAAIAVGGGKVLLGMINDLLDIEKMESGATELNYEQLSAATLIEGALRQVASLAAESETLLVTEIAASLPPFRGDAGKLSRTIVNLTANAIRFARKGTVTIAAVQQSAGTMQFSIRDTGAGIPEAAFERIFEKFGQLDPHDKVGTGLGLAFCKLAIEAHGGRIGVESTMAVGSTFSFTIPMSEPAA